MSKQKLEPSSATMSAVVTEHFVLQSARGTITSEAGSRISSYLAVVSGALVAVGFTSDSDAAGPLLALILPALIVFGVFTYRRLIEISLEDVQYIRAIKDIRKWYEAELSGQLPSSMLGYDAQAATSPLWSLIATGTRPRRRDILLTTASAAALVVSIIAATGVGLLLKIAGFTMPGIAVAVVCAAFIIFGSLVFDQLRRYKRIGL